MQNCQLRLRYNLPAALGREKGLERRLGLKRGLSPSDPSGRGAVWPDVLGVGPLSVAEDLGLAPLGPIFPGLAPRCSNTQVYQPSSCRYLGLCLIEFQVSGIQAPACIRLRGSSPHEAFRYWIPFPPAPIYGVQTPPSEIRDSATIALEVGEDWTARSDWVVTPSPPGEASRARPSGRTKVEEEVARGKASLPLSPLGCAAGGPRAEAEALGHQSDPYQVRCWVQGRGVLSRQCAQEGLHS